MRVAVDTPPAASERHQLEHELRFELFGKVVVYEQRDGLVLRSRQC